MRLLDLVTGDFVEFSSPSTTLPYAILSHRWDVTEQTYQDIQAIQKLCEKNGISSLPVLQPRLPFSSSLSHNGVSSFPPSPAHPQSIWDPDSGLSNKVRNACEAARRDGFRYLWIDSCCIDKTSSAELSESINSMFMWYRDAEVCYTFLVDVPTAPFAMLESKDSAFRSSVWFTRGWTLQELVAPRQLVFLSRTWEPLGTKASLSKLIEEITGIPMSVLASSGQDTIHQSLDKCSGAQRMSWAAHRNTAKAEDRAYSLLGIFDIQMSLLYGEGERAFLRLQEEILRRIPAQTIFAWGKIHPKRFLARNANRPVISDLSTIRNLPPSHPNEVVAATEHHARGFDFRVNSAQSKMMFAQSPRDFAGAGRVVAVPLDAFRNLLARFCEIFPQEYTFTPHGIRTAFPLLPLSECLPLPWHLYSQSMDWYLAILACEQSNFPGELLCCVCHVLTPKSLVGTLRRGYLKDEDEPITTFVLADLQLYPLFRCRLPSINGQDRLPNLRQHTVYLDHLERAPSPFPLQGYCDAGALEALTFTLCTWSPSVLDTRGYVVSLASPSEVPDGPGGVHRLTLSPRPPQTTAGLHRWTVVADFTYTLGSRERTIRAAVRITGGDGVSFSRSLEWGAVHWGAEFGWQADRLVDGVMLDAVGHESVKLELGVQLASQVSWYRIHVDVFAGLL